MLLTDALSKLLEETRAAAVNPSLWQDNAWKSNYYLYQNLVYDALTEIPHIEQRTCRALGDWMASKYWTEFAASELLQADIATLRAGKMPVHNTELNYLYKAGVKQ